MEGLYIEGCMLMPLLGGLILEMKKRISFPLTYFYLNLSFSFSGLYLSNLLPFLKVYTVINTSSFKLFLG